MKRFEPDVLSFPSKKIT